MVVVEVRSYCIIVLLIQFNFMWVGLWLRSGIFQLFSFKVTQAELVLDKPGAPAKHSEASLFWY